MKASLLPLFSSFLLEQGSENEKVSGVENERSVPYPTIVVFFAKLLMIQGKIAGSPKLSQQSACRAEPGNFW